MIQSTYGLGKIRSDTIFVINKEEKYYILNKNEKYCTFFNKNIVFFILGILRRY